MLERRNCGGEFIDRPGAVEHSDFEGVSAPATRLQELQGSALSVVRAAPTNTVGRLQTSNVCPISELLPLPQEGELLRMLLDEQADSSLAAARTISVSIVPGQTASTRMLSAA